MPTRFFIFLIFIFIGSVLQCNAQDTDQNTVSIELENSIQIRDIILEGNKLLAKQKYNDAIKKYALADSLAAEIENDRLQASSKHNIGLCYFRLGEYIICKDFFEDALFYSERIGDEVNTAQYLMSMGSLYKKQAAYSKSLEYIFESLKLSEKHNDFALIASAYNSTAGIQKSLGNYRESIQYYNDALKIFKKQGDQASIASVYNNIGNVFQVMDSLEISKVYYHMSIDGKQKLANERAIIISLKNLGESCLKLGQLDSAQYYYLQALEISEKINHKGKIGICLNALGELSIITMQYDSALLYLEKARFISIDYQLRKTLLENYRLSKDLFYKIQQNQKAFQFSELYNSLNREIYDQEKTKGINELRFKYETDKKDSEIIALNQINKLKNRNLVLISGALSLIVILTIGLFVAYRQKKNAHSHIQLLMNESQHRTKNNLQLLSSILSLHSAQVSAEQRDAVMSAEYRVQSIVLLNKQLDIDNKKGRISLSDYLKNLSDGLLDAYSEDGIIELITDFADIRILPHHATHLGLIANELITNSLKYAFDGVLKPFIIMECELIAKDLCKLIIRDNGNGLPPNWEERSESSLGLSLVKDLSEQLKGELQIKNKDGFYFQLVFPIK